MVLKRRLLFCLILILLLSAAARAEGGAAPIDPDAPCDTAVVDGVRIADFVRLHVVAEDDGDAAQALKLEVRDACLMCARTLLKDCEDADAAWATVNDNLDLIRLVAALRARSRGWDGAVNAETGVFTFPERRYGGVVVPAGEYRALRVVIGAGEGRNWWCVLYPSLCLTEDCVPGEPVHFHSTLLNWLRDLFGGAA